MDRYTDTSGKTSSCAQCKYGEKWENGEYHCLKEIGAENSSLHSGDWFCADFEETKEEIYYGMV